MRPVITALIWAALAIDPAFGAVCMASWYQRGAFTANGERFHPDGLTAASPSIPFGRMVRVTYAGRTVVVRINDFGPARWTHRCIDLSRGAARVLGILQRGTAPVRIDVLK